MLAKAWIIYWTWIYHLVYSSQFNSVNIEDSRHFIIHFYNTGGFFFIVFFLQLVYLLTDDKAILSWFVYTWKLIIMEAIYKLHFWHGNTESGSNQGMNLNWIYGSAYSFNRPYFCSVTMETRIYEENHLTQDDSIS